MYKGKCFKLERREAKDGSGFVEVTLVVEVEGCRGPIKEIDFEEGELILLKVFCVKEEQLEENLVHINLFQRCGH